MTIDNWHYPRTQLAKQVFNMFETGLSSALVFFAPRRMGKTEFLRKDIQPLAEKQGWKTFYFSFLDAEVTAYHDFAQALNNFTEGKGLTAKARGMLKQVSKVSGKAAGLQADVALQPSKTPSPKIKNIIAQQAETGNLLLLMDEVQVLAQNKTNDQLIAEFRTALDMHKDSVKVIFTGSSREGLRHMFSQASAPFFHFGQNLPFPELGKEFTDHLANTFKEVTNRPLDTTTLWDAFQEMEKIPQLARSLVERLALNPNLDIQKAKNQLLEDVFNDRAFAETWASCSALEKLLLHDIAHNSNAFFSEDTRNRLAKELGLPEVSVSTVQSALRTLQRKMLIGRLPDVREHFIDDPSFKNWLMHGH